MKVAKRYYPQEIEKKWQKKWQEKGVYRVKNKVAGKKNYYCLVMFPYSSGNAHIGHWYNFAPADVFARYQRMLGKNVLHPMGFDAFGLPAEGAAIRKKIHPAVWTKKNVQNMTRQLKAMGTIYDWSRLVNTSEPDYYRWTQWMFLQMYKHNLAYKKKAMANWCPCCQSILANEQAEGGKCWRCAGRVEQRQIEQWFFKITKYADELLEDLKKLDWPQKTLTMQKNWIGRSEGCLIEFPLADQKEKVATFTTRPDTIFGVTFFCLAPEHPIVAALLDSRFPIPDSRLKEIKNYVEKSKRKTELERMVEAKEKTGVFTGLFVINPLSKKKVPLFVADYVLMSYGTGAVMGVPAHDQRDWDFAKKYQLPIIEVISGGDVKKEAFLGEGKLVNSGEFSGLDSRKAIQIITNYIKKHRWGKPAVQYHLRDWLVSRQRYWGAPVPIIYCQKCGPVPVAEKDLPVLLPEIDDYTPKEGESPLARAKDWLKVACPQCGAAAQRDTDTMDTFVCSSWYYLRYVDPKNSKRFAAKEKIKAWLPVDMYIGGAEHTVLHLLYSRFFTKALRDFGYLDFDEPFKALRHQGVILGEDGFKMSKSRGNVVDPDDLVKKFGADTVRLYLCFMGPYDQGGPWNSKGIVGIYRFLNRIWRLCQRETSGNSPSIQKDSCAVKGEANKLTRQLHRLIKKVGADISKLHFNTAIAAMMEFLNSWSAAPNGLSVEERGIFLRLLAPFAPHLAEELWQQLKDAADTSEVSDVPLRSTLPPSEVEDALSPSEVEDALPPSEVEDEGERWSIHQQPWPKSDPRLAEEEKVTIIIQVNGKVRGQIEVESGIRNEEARIKKLAQGEKKVARHLEAKKIKKVIFVPGRLINFVI